MKKLFSASAIALAMIFGSAHAAEDAKPEVKKVCIDKTTKDGKPVLDKAGKPVQTCKEMKVHKKLEGTKVPEKK